MRDVSGKFETLRTAKAKATLKIGAKTAKLIRGKKVEKGDVFEISRAAGITGAKRTWELLPLCHPLPVDWIEVKFDLKKNAIDIFCTVKAIYKTGVEMEALTGASLAALCLYDMLKPHDDSLEIQNVVLLEKRGGKSDFGHLPPKPLKCVVLVLSDSVYAGKKEDRAGKAIMKKLEPHPVKVMDYKILPDEREDIKNALVYYSDVKKCDLILTTGGTGFSPRDITVEATKDVIERETTGISEAIRAYGLKRTPYSALSRAVSGMRGKTLMINLPGSTNGAKESMDALFPWIFHAFPVMEGARHDKRQAKGNGERGTGRNAKRKK